MSEDAEIVKEFLVESYENLDRLDQDLIALEKDPADRERLSSIFRTIHTIKGTSGFLAFNRLEAVTHVGENLLTRLRDGVLSLTPEITTAMLAMVDAVRQMLTAIEATGKEGERDDRALIATLTRLLDANQSAGPDTLPQVPAKEVATEPKNGSGKESETSSHEGRSRVQADSAIEASPSSSEAAQAGPQSEKGANASEASGPATGARGQNASDGTIRVDVSLLDQLMNLVGELVLARNQILLASNASEENGLIATSQRLNLITTELQESVMKTRMQPIGNIWSKFPRTVRDVALGCGKRVQIEMEGQETELDKTIIEAIKDPLTHLVRNAVDHGIESPEQRIAAGKIPEGRLCLRAFHEGGQVNIEIIDDGAGLNHDRIREKALQKGLVTADQASRMTEREVNNLIFLPGFSTAEKVTNVSGRGVGMDVVKTNIEKIGGIVDVQSRKGQGTTVHMKIPLTLAIIPALIVTSAGDRYAIPQVSLLELVRLEGAQAQKGIELVHGAPVHRLRGKLLPLVYMNRELKVHDEKSGSEASGIEARLDDVNIVVLQADDRQFGLVVDEINDTEEIVVKPLNKQLKSINTYAGATIMGDGKVALILDVLGLGQRANVVNEVRDRAILDKEEKLQGDNEHNKQRRAVLLFQRGENGRIAIDLGLVARLEEFPKDAVESAHDQEVVQYRGEIMPLVRVTDVLGNRSDSSARNEESLHVVVYTHNGRSVGLVVDRILDIVEETFVMQAQTGRNGVLGSAVIQKRVTDILDVPGLIAADAARSLAAAHP